jgi:hypothetical protein
MFEVRGLLDLRSINDDLLGQMLRWVDCILHTCNIIRDVVVAVRHYMSATCVACVLARIKNDNYNNKLLFM